MGASLPAVGSFPVRPASLIDRKRPIPLEIVRLDEKSSEEQITKAVKQMALDLYTPPDRWFAPEEEHRRLLAEAINHVGAAAFTPVTTRTLLSAATATGAVGTDVKLAGLDQAIVSPIPARLHLTLTVRISYDTMGALGTEARASLTLNTVAQSPVIAWVPNGGAAGDIYLFSQQHIVDILPQTVYTIEAYIRLAAGAGAAFTARRGPNNADTNLFCRVEPRIL